MTTLESLWHDYRHEIAGYITSRMWQERGMGIADDLVSIVYLRALVAMRNGNGATSNARGWLYQIARSAMVDYLRYGRAPVDMVSIDTYAEEDTDGNAGAAWVERALVSQEPTPHEQAERVETQARVRHAVSRLTRQQAQSLTLRLDGYEIGEIIEIMGHKRNTINAIDTRAYRTLREWLKEAA